MQKLYPWSNTNISFILLIMPWPAKKLLSTKNLKLNPDKIKFIIFGSKIHKKQQVFPFNIVGNFLQKQSGTLVYLLIVIFPFQGMPRIYVSPVLLKCLGVSEAI